MFVKKYMKTKEIRSNDMAPFGFISDGLDDEGVIIENDGTMWKTDEYGDMSYMWEYN